MTYVQGHHRQRPHHALIMSKCSDLLAEMRAKRDRVEQIAISAMIPALEDMVERDVLASLDMPADQKQRMRETY